MGFRNLQTTTSNVIPTDIKKETQKKELQLRIDAMNGSIKQLEDKKLKLEEQTELVLGASSNLELVNLELTQKQSELVELNKKIVLANEKSSELAKLEENVSRETNKLNDLVKQNKELSKIVAELPKLKEEYTQLLQEISNAHSTFTDLQINSEETMTGIKLEITEAQKILRSYNLEIKDSKELLKESNEELIKLKEKVLKAQNDLKSVLDTTKQAKIQSQAQLDTELAEKKAKFDVEILNKTLELEKREGEVSDKNALLLEKEKQLRDTKIELEKFYNRKIAHIII